MRNRSGFTLIELMVVICIIAVTAVFAVPNYLEWLPRARAKGAAMDLVGELQRVKLRAIKENQTMCVYFHRASHSYYVISEFGANAPLCDGPTTVGGDDPVDKTVILSHYGSGVQYDTVTPTSIDKVEFDSRGHTDSVQFIITNQGNTASYQVQTTLVGGIIIDKL